MNECGKYSPSQDAYILYTYDILLQTMKLVNETEDKDWKLRKWDFFLAADTTIHQ